MARQPRAQRLFDRLTPGGERNFLDTFRTERAGGVLLLAGALVALVWANSAAADSYVALRQVTWGPSSLGLNLSLETWAKDGLLAIFFFVVGLELKRELVTGELRHPRTAALPAIAAVGGIMIPAIVYLAVNSASDQGVSSGWAIPTATDIAFALAVLGVVGRRLPVALRAFLLTLAVVDDLLAILIIAVAYTASLNFVWLVGAVLCVTLFWWLLRRGFNAAWVLLPIAVAGWVMLHASGIHATLMGVALGLVVPAVAKTGAEASLAERWEHFWRPVSAGLAVPIFALFAAGVSVRPSDLAAAFTNPVPLGIAAGLVLGKPIGILLATFLVARFTKATLPQGLSWWDVTGVGVLAGIGFTVSLLIAQLSFAGTHADAAKVGVLAGSVIAALAGSAILAWRSALQRRLAAGHRT